MIGLCQHVISQTKGRIAGNVYDEQTMEPLPYVNISIMKTQYGTTSNVKGHYELKLSPGSYELMFSMIGYKPYRKEVTLINEEIIDCNVTLSPTVLYMPGFTVIAPKTAQQKQNESVSSFAFETKKIKELPFSLNDINRALKILPGISSNNEKSSEFNVRGGSFEENLVQIDGVTIYRPFHLKEMPNASISILNMNLMQSVNLITGGFPAKYGDKLSSVLEIQYRSGNMDRLKSQIEIGAVNANLLVEGPLGERCSAIVGYNKSYFQPAMQVMNRYFPEFLSDITGYPGFYDIQGRALFNFNEQHQASLLVINSKDRYVEEPRIRYEEFTRSFESVYARMKTTDNSEFNGEFSNTLIAFQLSNQFSGNFHSSATLSYYDEFENLVLTSDYIIKNRFYYHDSDAYRGFTNYNNCDQYRSELSLKTIEAKEEWALKLSPYHELESGVYFQQLKTLYNLTDRSERITFHNLLNYPDTSKIDTIFYDDNYDNTSSFSSTSYKAGGHFQDNWHLSENLFANIGIRFDYFDFNRNVSISPRISCSYVLNTGSLLKFAWGVYEQTPMYNEFKYEYASSENTQNQRAIHYIAGIQQKILDRFELRLEGYFKDYKSLIPYYLRSGYKLSTQENSAIGYAKGFDLQFKYSLRSLSGWLSYGYLIAKEKNREAGTGYYPRTTDQRHSLAAIVDWAISKQWRIYGKFLYGSGFPYTPMVFEIETQRFITTAMNSEYLPAYRRFDLRLSRYFDFSWGQCEIYLEGINIFNCDNVFTYHHYGIDEYGNTTKEPKMLLPCVPNAGFKLSL
ncbi:TonB-dependent receptor [candidate division KSB1 bacterium]|nr:TonB-dependent receptor [candidate division KSB1 bacterium]